MVALGIPYLLTYLLTNWALADWSPELFLATNWAPANWAPTNWAPRKYWCGKLGHWKIETPMFLPSKLLVQGCQAKKLID